MPEETFQSFFLALLARANLTQKAAAARAGVSAHSVSRFLQPRSKQKPLRTLGPLCEVLGCSPAERIKLYALAQILPPEVLTAWIERQFVIEGDEIVLRATLAG